MHYHTVFIVYLRVASTPLSIHQIPPYFFDCMMGSPEVNTLSDKAA